MHVIYTYILAASNTYICASVANQLTKIGCSNSQLGRLGEDSHRHPVPTAAQYSG